MSRSGTGCAVLSQELRLEPKPQPSVVPAAPPQAAPSAPAVPSIFPESALLPPQGGPLPAEAVPRLGPRPLLDLFPPPSGRLRGGRGPTLDGTLRSFSDEAPASLIHETRSAANELELESSPSDGWIARVAPTITLAVGFMLLMLAGASAAAWVYRDEVSRLLSQW